MPRHILVSLLFLPLFLSLSTSPSQHIELVHGLNKLHIYAWIQAQTQCLEGFSETTKNMRNFYLQRNPYKFHRQINSFFQFEQMDFIGSNEFSFVCDCLNIRKGYIDRSIGSSSQKKIERKKDKAICHVRICFVRITWL